MSYIYNWDHRYILVTYMTSWHVQVSSLMTSGLIITLETVLTASSRAYAYPRRGCFRTIPRTRFTAWVLICVCAFLPSCTGSVRKGDFYIRPSSTISLLHLRGLTPHICALPDKWLYVALKERLHYARTRLLHNMWLRTTGRPKEGLNPVVPSLNRRCV
jgi:hypothetical protein